MPAHCEIDDRFCFISISVSSLYWVLTVYLFVFCLSLIFSILVFHLAFIYPFRCFFWYVCSNHDEAKFTKGIIATASKEQQEFFVEKLDGNLS